MTQISQETLTRECCGQRANNNNNNRRLEGTPRLVVIVEESKRGKAASFCFSLTCKGGDSNADEKQQQSIGRSRLMFASPQADTSDQRGFLSFYLTSSVAICNYSRGEKPFRLLLLLGAFRIRSNWRPLGCPEFASSASWEASSASNSRLFASV